jgi:FkbM family methyltransferase
LGTAGFRWFGSTEVIAGPLDLFARIWLRHRKLRSHLRTQQFDGVVDGGANVGEFAQIVRAALPNADLVCVEPHPASAAALRKQNFKVVEAALWNKPGRLRLTQPTFASTSCTVLAPNEIAEHGWEVEAIRLDSLSISGSRLLIKLDLQGAEFNALEGMGELWNRCAGLLSEVTIGRGATYEKMRELLARRGFYEYSTTNELASAGHVIEADKLWLREIG